MSSGFKKNKDSYFLAVILIIAAILRFYNFWNLPFMHDEFSAIFRTYYDNLGQLIEEGVKNNDSHPAGVQIFIYFWIKLFGLSEWSLKLPFLISGLLAVFVNYKLALKWFGNSTAILSSSLMAVLQINIFYSQLARPYSPGLLFVLLSTYYWTKLLFEEKKIIKNLLLYSFSAAAAAYIHAFALFFVFVQGMSGLLLINKKNFIKYLAANALIILLYIPHIPIFFAQLGRGDIGGWLGKPDNWFIIEFIKYSFHYSYFLIFIVLFSAIAGSIIVKQKKSGLTKFRLLAVAWFLISFLTAFLYSLLRSPIIQYSTLLFVFPFLLMFIFSFIGEGKFKLIKILSGLIMAVAIFTLIFNRQHYSLMYRQGFDGAAINIKSDYNSFEGKKAIVVHSPETRMYDFYFDKFMIEGDVFKYDVKSQPKDLLDFINKERADIVFYSWADYRDLSVLALLKTQYPYVIKRENFFNSEYYILSKNKPKKISEAENTKTLSTIEGKNGEPLYIASKKGYSQAVEEIISANNTNENTVLNIAAEFRHIEKNSSDLLVFDLQDKSGNSVSWSAANLSDFISDNSENDSIYYVTLSKRIMSLYPLPDTCILKSYIWKRDTLKLELEKMSLYTTEIDRVETGLYGDLKK